MSTRLRNMLKPLYVLLLTWKGNLLGKIADYKIRTNCPLVLKTREKNYVIDCPPSDLREHWIGILSGTQEDFRLTRRIVETHCRKNPIIVVAGANIGLNEIALSQIDGATIISFEPVPTTYAILNANIRNNGIDNVKTINAGLSSRSGTLHIGISSDSGSSSITKTNAAKRILCKFETIDAFFAEHGIKRLDFLKIDVEGHDIEVLKGGEQTIRRDKPVIQIEIIKHGATDFFSNYDIGWMTSFLREFDCSFYELYRGKKVEIRSLEDFLLRDVIQNDLLIVLR